MSCLLTSGYQLGCRAQAGVTSVYIGSWTNMTYSYQVDGFTIGTFSGTTASFYTFQQTIETANFTSAAEINNENNAIQYAQSLEITLTNLTASMINQIKVLGQGTWRIMILDKQGNYWLMGGTGPVQVSAVASGLGKAGTDLNGGTLTFTSKEIQPLIAVSPTAALSLIV
jgi:hypothetical protein